jgi:hypothetical protein
VGREKRDHITAYGSEQNAHGAPEAGAEFREGNPIVTAVTGQDSQVGPTQTSQSQLRCG